MDRKWLGQQKILVFWHQKAGKLSQAVSQLLNLHFAYLGVRPAILDDVSSTIFLFNVRNLALRLFCVDLLGLCLMNPINRDVAAWVRYFSLIGSFDRSS